MNVEPRPEHAWLQRMVGAWESEAHMNCGDTPSVSRGQETGRALGAFWVQMEGECEIPGGATMTTQLTLGYDVDTERFVGSWIGSVMSQMWIYDITREGENRLIMAAEGPSMTGEGRTRYRDIIEFVNPERRTMTSWSQGADGEWTQFMRVDYRRR